MGRRHALRGAGRRRRRREDGTSAQRVESVPGRRPAWCRTRVEPVEVDRVLIATGRRPRTAGLGLEALGLQVDEGSALDVDPRCRVRSGSEVFDDVFAIGDVTGISPYTHSANYQAPDRRRAPAGAARPRRRLRAIPRAVYTDPAVFSVGLSADAARQQGHDVASAQSDVPQTGRAFVEGAAAGRSPRPARLELVADLCTGRLVGAVAVGPTPTAGRPSSRWRCTPGSRSRRWSTWCTPSRPGARRSCPPSGSSPAATTAARA